VEVKMIQLDCRGLICPLPIVRLAQRLADVAIGGQICILASDPAFRADLDAWLDKTKNVLRSIKSVDDVVEAVVEKRR
jgi:tRNA 2-thiouridine synthesizing protein A